MLDPVASIRVDANNGAAAGPSELSPNPNAGMKGGFR